MQTTVELLLNELEEYDFKVSPSIRKRYIEMEKQQIVDAYNEGYLNISLGHDEVGERYYNETYKK